MAGIEGKRHKHVFFLKFSEGVRINTAILPSGRMVFLFSNNRGKGAFGSI